jgi:hypothetical protein
MNRNLLIGAMVLVAGNLLAADPTPKDAVTAAAKKLADQANYSWKTTVVVPESSPWKPGPTEGKAEKDGFTHVSMSFGDNTSQVVMKGDKIAATNQDGDWQSVDEMEKAEGPGRFFAMMLRNMKSPTAQAAELVAGAKELKKDGDAYSSDLTDDATKTLLTFRGGDATVTNPKGSVQFWLKDGVLSKYVFKVKGLVKFGDNEVDIDRATTVEVKEVGSTKLAVPEPAKKKLS